MTADAAVRGIRKLDPHGSIGLISAEYVPPYFRPLLSKDLWKGKPLERVWCHTKSLGVEFHLGRIVQTIDPDKKRVTDNQGQVYTYKKLLLATGGKPKRFPFGGDQIIYFRTFGDYERLRWLAERSHRFAVIGGGFIGSEIAAALAMKGKEVTMIFPQETIGARMFPHELGLSLNEYYFRNGVDIWPHETVVGVDTNEDESLTVRTMYGEPLIVDGVVAGIGIQPNVTLAEIAGLRTEDGILVDEFLRTNHSDIYAAGDVASFYNPVLEKRMRVEHEDSAKTMGDFAGRNMAGDTVAYRHQPFFYSDLFDLGYEAVGEVDSSLETVEDWKEPYREGVVYYLKDQRVRGVLLWNVWGEVNSARELIAESGPFRAQDLKGKLPMAVQHQPG
jgi:NADPH-dependent 2,4-dienoyl-CoA reductase/sulfur reductase-like enzyme